MDELWWLALVAAVLVIVVGVFIVRRARRSGSVLASRLPDRSER